MINFISTAVATVSATVMMPFFLSANLFLLIACAIIELLNAWFYRRWPKHGNVARMMLDFLQRHTFVNGGGK